MKEKYNCPYCKRMIIKDIFRYLQKYTEERYVYCPYCGWHIKMEKIKEDLKL